MTVEAETLVHQGCGMPPIATWLLVERHVPDMSSRGRALTGVELASPRQRALRLLHHRALEWRVDLMMGPMILGCRRLREPSEQGHHDSNVLACPSEVWEGSIVFDDPLVHVMGHGVRTPTVSVALDLSLELCALPLELESCIVELLASHP